MVYVKKQEIEEEEFEQKIEYFKKTGQSHTILYGSVFINGKQYKSNLQKVSNYIMNSSDRESSLEVLKREITVDLRKQVNEDNSKRKHK